MLYNITINQKAITDAGLVSFLDIEDAAILCFVYMFSSNPQANKIEERYVWISYNLILQQLPMIKMKKDAVYRRMCRYVDMGLLELHPKSKALQKSLYAVTDKLAGLYYGASDIEPMPSGLEPIEHRVSNRDPSGLEPMYNNTIYNSNNENTISKRAEIFKALVMSHSQYPPDMLNEFIQYWTEPNKSKTKMLYELCRTWDLERRLVRWANNPFNAKKVAGEVKVPVKTKRVLN